MLKMPLPLCAATRARYAQGASRMPPRLAPPRVARTRPDSDLDVMIDIDPAAHVTLFDFVGLKDYIAGLFDRPVDVIDREALKPHLRVPTAQDVMYAF
jgi:hypothetical protein